MEEKLIYLDNHSATRPCGPALERMRAAFEEGWAAGFAPHQLGQEIIASLDARYRMIYDFIGASYDDSFAFTSSGAEAIHQVHWTAFSELARKSGKCHFITCAAEDAPLLQSLKRLEELGCFVKIAPLDAKGQIDLGPLEELINPRTAMISLSHAHGLSGVVQPIEEIARIAQAKNVLLHVDATYALGKILCPFQELPIDYLTFSGDRIHSVKGSGGLFAKANRPLIPLITGGMEQGTLRGGALDVPSFMALAAAAGQASLAMDLMGLETARLRDRLEEMLVRNCDAQRLLQDAMRLPNVALLSFPRVHQEALLYDLHRKGIFASIGGTYSPHLARTLVACGIDERCAESAISFSLSRYTTEQEIDRAAILIAESVRSLQQISEGLFR